MNSAKDIGFAHFRRIINSIEQAVRADRETLRKNEAEEARRRAESEKVKLLGMLAHDIRTPLTVISGYRDIEPHLTPDERATAVEGIHKSAMKISRLIDDMLAITMMESPSFVLDLDVVDLRRMLDDAIGQAIPPADKKGVCLRLDIDEGLPMIHADEPKLARAFANLLSNAVGYNKSGGSIIVSARPDGKGKVVIEVADTGHGVDDSELPFIFEKFYRSSRSARKKKGSGLGLAIVKAAVEAHSGSVSVESAMNVGSVFKVVLPVAQPGYPASE